MRSMRSMRWGCAFSFIGCCLHKHSVTVTVTVTQWLSFCRIFKNITSCFDRTECHLPVPGMACLWCFQVYHKTNHARYMHTYIHTYIHMYVHTYILCIYSTCMLMRHRQTNTCAVPAKSSAYIHTYIHTYIRKYIHTHTQIHIHTHMHTYTYIHTYTGGIHDGRACPRTHTRAVRLPPN